uniref:25S rRNA (uridine-N(3))-methyltransferase BMT5-like domain-containing protein n=1 Tax=Alexandrium monilatum TaxID=311494 RepID=A0A7S4WBT1_9DINO|mmetsp:Transcript_108957/g.347523  ORF Transcript_108957/g.347523 Transcript_108957/m.347523 type:complete len:583 (+) Transcript_108957:42-1790(+)
MAEQEEEPIAEGEFEGDVPAEGDEELMINGDGGEEFDALQEEEVPEEGEEPPAEEEAPAEDEELPPLDEDGEPAMDEAEAAPEEPEADVPAEEPEPEVPVKEEEDEADDGEPVVEEHLKDAVEGSLRLKRLLSRDDTDIPGKRQKLNGGDEAQRPIHQAKVKQLLAKWNMKTDSVVKHVLDNMSFDELRHMSDSNFVPDRWNQRKSPSELVAAQILDMKERKLGGGSRCDVVGAFKNRWKLDREKETKLRALTHKDLRYVISKFDGKMPLEDLITEASAEFADGDGDSTIHACPDRPGVKTMGRFNRLELIDPLADCAVFGDANLTFAMLLAKHRKELGHVGRVIATTFEEVETLRERYKEIDQSIQTLEEHHAEVYHGVDCTRIAIDPRFQGMEGKLGAVYYNFPHSGAIGGFFDSHPMVNWRHENLMRLFFRALRSFVKPGGCVKVSSNSSAVGVRYSYIVGSAIENEFIHVETMPFLEWHLHRYGRSYGDRRDVYKRPDAKNNQSYNAQSAVADMVYCFEFAPSDKTLPKQQIRMPPTLKTLQECKDGPFRNLSGQSKVNLANQLHERFMKEVSGIHVG